MNESYLEKYVDLNGNVNQRTFIERLGVIIFAGVKFFFDRFLAVLGLILTSPIMLIIAIAIKLDSEGPILFKQERTGKNGKTFNVYKFRTMVAKNDVHDFSKADEHTKVGQLLRKTSLDELPQMFAVDCCWC